MKDPLIKLHDDFVSKGMKRTAFLNIMSLAISGRKSLRIIEDKDIGYVLLDMQTWLREEHGIHLCMHYCGEKDKGFEYAAVITKNDKYGWSLGGGKPSKDYNEALLSGLQEAIKLIE